MEPGGLACLVSWYCWQDPLIWIHQGFLLNNNLVCSKLFHPSVRLAHVYKYIQFDWRSPAVVVHLLFYQRSNRTRNSVVNASSSSFSYTLQTLLITLPTLHLIHKSQRVLAIKVFEIGKIHACAWSHVICRECFAAENILPRIFCQEYFAQNVLPRMPWQKYFAKNTLPKIFCRECLANNVLPRMSCQEYFAENVLPRIFCWEYFTENVLPRIFCRECPAENILPRMSCQEYFAGNVLARIRRWKMIGGLLVN